MLEEDRDEGALPGLELLASPVDRALGQGRRREVVVGDILEADLGAGCDPLDLLDDRVRQRVAVGPERLELLLDPGDPFVGRVLPEDLVVRGEGALRLVDRAEERGLRAVGLLDDPGLTVDEDPVLGTTLTWTRPLRRSL